MKSKITISMIQVILLCVAGLCYGQASEFLKGGYSERSRHWVGKEAPAFYMADLNGNMHSPESLQNKVVVMNFWFTACAPCVTEIPELNKVVAKYRQNDDVVFLAFALNAPKVLVPFLREKAFDYRQIPFASSIANDYGANAFPTHVIVDKEGIIRIHHVGLVSEEMLEVEIEKLL